MSRIFSISGKARHGKDTIANVMVKDFGFRKISFADALKNISSKMFNIELDTFYNDNKKDKQFEEPVVLDNLNIVLFSEYVSDVVGMPAHSIYDSLKDKAGKVFNTPRELLQYVGTELGREVDTNLWLKLTSEELKKGGNIVVPDARFPNERELVKSMGGLNMLVLRNEVLRNDDHASENMLGSPDDYHVVVKNYDTVHFLEQDIKQWLEAKLKT